MTEVFKQTFKYILPAVAVALCLTSCVRPSHFAKELWGLTQPYNPKVEIGNFSNFKMDSLLAPEDVTLGKSLYRQRCKACHSLSDKIIIGPGWKGITKRRSDVWLMNFLTNTDEMIEIDSSLQVLIAKGFPRMPDQNLNEEQAQAIIEFMKENDR